MICRGGNIRSVAVAFLLKYKYSCDALAASFEKNDPSTLRMLVSWAQSIIVTEQGHLSLVPPEFAQKIQLVDIGRDVWAQPLDHDLLDKADTAFKGSLAAKAQASSTIRGT